MNARTFFNPKLTLALVALVVVGSIVSGCGKATPEPTVYRIGLLCGVDFFANTKDGFMERMAELGYIEGETIVYDVHHTNVDPAAEQRILEQFVTDEVDLIITFPTEVSLAAKAITRGTGIPVLFANAHLEGVGLVDSILEPGDNITGVRYPGPDLAIKRFEIMLELLPKAKRIWLPYQRGYPTVQSQLDVLRPLAESSGVTLVEAPVSNTTELQAELEALATSSDIGIDAILQIAEPIGVDPEAFAIFAAFAAEHTIPVGGAFMAVNGYHSVFGVSTDNVAVGRQAATMAHKILTDTPAGTIPVVSAEPYLAVNYKAAQTLRLTVPEGLLSQADNIVR